MQTDQGMSTLTATYSPEDNKLRLYSLSRLDSSTYDAVRAAGFIWAPKQELWVAPAWSPDREDLLISLCGEIGDEDTSLVDRAEERAERFEDYAENRKADAEHAHAAVAAIADNIPLGQPILIGHHSEKRARKDAERIQNGMNRAVKMWDQAKYWAARAKGAVRNAKYKERPDVRSRRIKGLEADLRKQEKTFKSVTALIGLWSKIGNPGNEGRECDDALKLTRALYISNHDHVSKCFTLEEFPRAEGASTYEGMMSLWGALGGGEKVPIITPDQAAEIATRVHWRTISRAVRWIAHLNNRLTYERAMLAEAGGLVTDRTQYPIVPGGRVLVREEWLMVLKINRANGRINSIRTQKPSRNTHWSSLIPIESIKDYQPPTVEDTRQAKATTKLPPLVNYAGDGVTHMLTADYRQKVTFQSAHTRVVAATDEHGAHRQRFAMMTGFKLVPVFLTDSKVVERPSLQDAPPRQPIARVFNETATPTPVYPPAEPDKFDALRDTLRAGIKVVSAPQLFPTAPDVARQLVDAADVQPGQRVLEPSAGTGNLIRAIVNRFTGADCGIIVAVEINPQLVNVLREFRNKLVYANENNLDIRCADFLTCNGDLGKFHRIVMNPPFKDAADIKHILHARTLLKPNGRLAAICANGPRQQKTLKPIAREWIDLPPQSFDGTNVNAAIVVIDAEE